MKIFLVNVILKTQCSYNYGLGYIAGALKEQGHDVQYMILNKRRDIRRLYSAIQKEDPKIVAISSTSSYFVDAAKIAQRIKKISNSFVVYGGIHATLCPECIVGSEGIDAIVRGEGELPMTDLAAALEKKEDYLKIKNIWFRQGGEIIKNECRDLISDLDRLPFPDKSSLDYQGIIDKQGGLNRFIFSRGCVFDCPYCSNKALMEFYGGKGIFFRSRSPQKAIEEIERDSARYNFNTIFFDDDSISLDKKWFYDFFNLYKGKFRYPFYCNVRPKTLDPEMARLLKESGAKGVVIGIEHGNQDYRKNVLKRDITDEEIINTFKMCEEAGIRENVGQVMIGLPYEDLNLFLDTVRLCRRINASYYWYIFSPYPKTEFGRMCEKNSWLPDRSHYLERREAVISYPKFKKEEIQLCHDIFECLVHSKPPLPLTSRFLSSSMLLKLYRPVAVFQRGVDLLNRGIRGQRPN